MPHSNCSCAVERRTAAGVPSHLHPTPVFTGALVSVADWSCCAPRSAYAPEEAATGFQLIFARAGLCAIETRHGRAVVDASTAVLFNAGDTYRVAHPVHGGDASTLLAFDQRTATEVAASLDPSILDRDKLPFPVSTVVVTPDVLIRYRRLRSAAQRGSAALAIDEESLALLARVLRSRANADERGAHTRRTHRTYRAHRDLAVAVQETLARAPGHNHSLSSVAQIVGASPYHMSRIFREITGAPIHRYLLRLRLALALERVAGGETSLTSVALSLGFVDQSHFGSAFRAAYGVTPARARRELAA